MEIDPVLINNRANLFVTTGRVMPYHLMYALYIAKQITASGWIRQRGIDKAIHKAVTNEPFPLETFPLLGCYIIRN